MLHLFEKYPRLQEKLPYRSFGTSPTPVEKLEYWGQVIHVPNLYAKREDRNGTFYGGNKVRALAFLLVDTLQEGVEQVMAGGFPASCQALAQVISARQFDIKRLSILKAFHRFFEQT